MCAIVDANVTFEVFGRKQTEAGRKFRDWLDGNGGALVVGGKNLTELAHNGSFRRWFVEARRLTGRVRQVGKAQIEIQEEELRRGGRCRSDDEHVLALALVSGARLLYSNDGDLKDDFSDAGIIQRPKGRVYTTQESKSYTPEHQALLETKNLCRGVRKFATNLAADRTRGVPDVSRRSARSRQALICTRTARDVGAA